MSVDAVAHHAGRSRTSTLTLAALGVVFGDIGTSPLYTVQTCFSAFTGLEATRGDVLGMLSLITWALVIVVTLKYVIIVMRADNHGEGGVLALMALVSRAIMLGNDLVLSLLAGLPSLLVTIRNQRRFAVEPGVQPR